MSSPSPGRLASKLLELASRPRCSSSRLTSCRRTIHSSPLRRSPSENASTFTSSSSRPAPKTASIFRPTAAFLAGGGLLTALFTVAQTDSRQPASSSSSTPPAAPAQQQDTRDPSLPRFRLADIRQHDASSGNPWVTHADRVYDITDWVPGHPGGDVILRAAGGAVDPYWAIFTIHNSDHVRQILDQYLIGFIDAVDLVDGRPPADAIEDPFKHDPKRDPRLKIHTPKPCNAEPPPDVLDREFITPSEVFYVRNHMWVPTAAEEEEETYRGHTLTVELPDGETKTYTLDELRRRFPTHRITVALQCSGNRRSDMTRHAGKTNGLQWGAGAISNAQWEGVRLADVLADAGLKVADPTELTRPGSRLAEGQGEGDLPDANTHHVQFSGLEAYGASIPLATALDPRGDVLLAFGMNGRPLPPDHGFPLRAVVPGHVAARSVKWLSRIVVADEESTSQWQRRDYKSFGPNQVVDPPWDKAPAIQEMPITSAVTGVWVGQCVRDGMVPWLGGRSWQKEETAATAPPVPGREEPIALQGYALSGGGRRITRVDVSLDDGKTWDQAELVDDCGAGPGGSCGGNKAWAWTRWRYVAQLPAHLTAAAASSSEGGEKNKKGRRECATVVVKATDDSYNTQPETHRSIYNLRGNLANAWHRVRVCPACEEGGEGGKKEKLVWRTGQTFGCGFEQEKEDEKLGGAAK
ncbi:hypothetical protein NKR23_g3720 [Pleurostoma richardsiae]|uniref:Nitrate reductase [NADPH] n=1 Tax=Pleurostoma richardsiae TaxID=41990 RepID=A0AA38S471_9PEZI|nr:hypothetical protein NKR23_g3720 [Pleurostoma richardsiae]